MQRRLFYRQKRSSESDSRSLLSCCPETILFVIIINNVVEPFVVIKLPNYMFRLG
jgi:hypothetical protein